MFKPGDIVRRNSGPQNLALVQSDYTLVWLTMGSVGEVIVPDKSEATKCNWKYEPTTDTFFNKFDRYPTDAFSVVCNVMDLHRIANEQA